MMAEKKKRELLRTPFITMLVNIAWVYLVFFLCHFVFVIFNWDVFDGQLNSSVLWRMLAGALKFDTAGIMYITVPYIALMMFPLHIKETKGYYGFCKVLLIVLASAGVLANLADTVYFPFTGCRSTFQVFSEFSNEGGGQIGTIFADAIRDNWPLLLFFILTVLFLIWRIKVPETLKYRRLGSYYAMKTVLLCISAVLCVVGMRGGWSVRIRPIAMSNAYQYANRPADAAAILNTPFCAIRSAGKKMTVPQYFGEEELDSIYTPVCLPDSNATFTPKNVVVLILESFGSEYSAFENRGVEGIHDCMPFLDSLMERSLTFEYSMANGRKSIDAMPSILSGIPMLKEHFFLTPTMMHKDVSGLADELGSKGYYSAFFHGADNNSMGFRSFSRVIGYNDYYGREDFEDAPEYGGSKAFDGVWAIWDEEFLQFMCDRMGSFREPFLVSAFTASSHHPFNIPDRYKEVFRNEGNLPVYRTIRYSDHALRMFFEKAATQPWYKNTLFVITADHTNLSEHPNYQADYGQFRVPIIFFDPAAPMASRRQSLAQQSDILPSILGYLGYDRPIVCFGQDLFHTDPEDVWVADYQNGLYFFYRNELMTVFDGNETIGVYEYRKDPRMKENIKGRYPESEAAMQRQLMAIIQQYMEHMTTKDLVIR